MNWRKSSYSGPNGGECVEIAHTVDMTGVRDSKNPGAGVLVFGTDAWSRFLVGRAGGDLR
ncbi:DUF397 domain-containing protein [Saccharothrix longispora]|uniref:DUF397 domain-containing protein n=1 Tax=Saccharothrix longispora TaxID=33920 RepID=UPI0028FD4B5D|nr:DUF397 domain-containing protein [Saccharothrix longispora]MBY8848601.1 DUF397 domain-containing protein [Saccharothrix sp. MB29]MDU0288471.1 DUF397 domain-containing protein [Saccharothrix longispora]